MITTIVLFLMLAVGIVWAFDLLVVRSEQSPVEAIGAGFLIGFPLTNLLYTFTGI